MNINDRTNGRDNNYDVIRFIAATLVVFSHSYPLTTGDNNLEPLGIFSNGQTTLGHLGVLIFFVISGFLITQSYDRNKNATSFVKKRVLRIFPALIVVIVLSTFLLGPIVTTLSSRHYFTNINTYNYLKAIFLYPMQLKLPGVFTTNPFPSSVNGSLGTLPVEFLFYFVILFLGKFKMLNKKFILGIAFLAILFPLGNFPIGNIPITSFTIGNVQIVKLVIGEKYIDLFRYFVAGSLFYLYKDKISLNWKIALISFVLVIMSFVFGQFNTIFAIFGSYLIFYLTYHPKIKLNSFSKFGDISYGIYIYSFPVQQLITYCSNGNISPFLNFAIAFPIVTILAYISWHLIEKNMLKLK